MKKQTGAAKKADRRNRFVESFSPFAHLMDQFAIVHWYFPIFGPYVLSKVAGIPYWLRIGRPWFTLGEDKFYLLFAFVLILVVLAFLKWMQLIPHVMTAFKEKGLVVPKPGGNAGFSFEDFLEKYQMALKSRKRFLVIVPFLLFVGWVLVLMSTSTTDIASEIIPDAFQSGNWSMMLSVVFFYGVTGFLWTYCAGVAAWIMGVTGWYLWRLPIQFEVKVQASHPDRCGGLRFLGNFCFRMVIPILIGAVLMGIVGLVGGLLSASDELRLASNLALILIVLPLTYVTFFTPMWGIHTEMQKRKTEFEEDLASHLLKLDSRTKRLLQQEQFDEAKKTLDELNAIKASSAERFPVWPFDLAILARFLTPQVVPVISFIFGVKKDDYLKILDYLVNLK